MNCLHCGDCCNRMSPIGDTGKCPYVIKTILNRKDYYFCSRYEKRPDQCIKHSFDTRHCPIGVDVANCENIEDIRLRIEEGYEFLNTIKERDL